jgi:hypothetical protein
MATEEKVNTQFLAKRSCCFCWASVLDTNDLYEIRNTAEVVLLIFFAGKAVNVDCHGSKGLFL